MIYTDEASWTANKTSEFLTAQKCWLERSSTDQLEELIRMMLHRGPFPILMKNQNLT